MKMGLPSGIVLGGKSDVMEKDSKIHFHNLKIKEIEGVTFNGRQICHRKRHVRLKRKSDTK